MPRSFLRQDTQIRNPDVYDDTLAAGSTLETGAATGEDAFNSIHSQLNRILDATLGGNWYDDAPTVNGKQRGLLQLLTEQDALEEKKFLCRANILTDVTVPAAQNWYILNVAGSEAPSEVAAVLATTDGAVVAQSALDGAGFDVAEPTLEVTGPDAISPKNLLIVRDAATGQPIQSSGRDVFGLLQYEGTGTDGGTFNDTSSGNRVKITFVRQNAALDDLEACPVADIENEVINYSYVRRIKFDTFPEDCFLSQAGFVDQSASVDVTRQRAYDNQGTTPVELANNAFLDLGAGLNWDLRDALDARVLGVDEDSTGGTTTIQFGAATDVFDNDAISNDFASGLQAATGSTQIDVGVTAGVIETLASNDLTVYGNGELLLHDGNLAAEATWTQTGVKLSETTTEVTDYETAFGGEVSLFNALVQAYNTGNRTKGTAVVTGGSYTAGTNMTGAGGTPNLDVQLPDYSSVAGSFAESVDVFLNGQLLRGDNSTTGANNHDVYPGDTPANGDLKFEFTVRSTGPAPDVITSIVYL